MADTLAYLAAVITGLWGVAHAVPTRQVVAGFEPLTADNRRVLVQEWLAEAVTMWAIAAVVVAATATGGAAAVWVDRAAAGALVALAALTGLTGARTRVVWFKVCPFLMATSALLLLAASVA